MSQYGLTLTRLLPNGNNRDARLCGSIGLSLIAHMLLLTTVGFALTPNIQVLADRPMFSDIVAILEFEDTPAKDSQIPVATASIAPAKPKKPAIATPRPPRKKPVQKTKIAKQRKKTPKAEEPAKLDANTAARPASNDNMPEEKLHPQAIAVGHEPTAEPEYEVLPAHDTIPEYPRKILAATANIRAQHQGDNLKTRAPRYNAPGLRNPRPKYPRLARNKGYTGEVLLKVNVSKLGTVAAAMVAQSSGYTLLDRSALRTIKTWRFLPAERGGSVVDAEIMVPVSFRLLN